MIYRLYGLKRRNPKSFQHPRFFSKFIRKYVYHPLANSRGAILESLDEKILLSMLAAGVSISYFNF